MGRVETSQSLKGLESKLRNFDSRLTTLLDVKVHAELKRVWAHPQGLNLALALVSYPAINQLRREDIAFQEEGMIVFERLERFIQRTRKARHVLQSFGREIVDVLVERLARIDAVLNAVKP